MRSRIVRVAIWVCLLTALLLGMQTAQAADNDSRVDAVIIVDVSTSMNQNEQLRSSNTPSAKIYDAAYDAATMFIQMCEMNGSRVAVVPFADGVYSTQESTGSYEWCRLRSISDLNTRNELVSYVRKLRSANNTDLGPAMQTAYELLAASRGDAEANKPMILLLTDGYIEIFKDQRKQEDATRASENQAEEYARLSREAGINIYCIGLESENYNGDNLKTYTNDPEKVYKTDDVAELPRIFNEIFADQIGARVIEDIDWTENADGTVTLEINIPNRSILEANVILSVDENAEQPEVYDPVGQYANGAENVTLFGGMSYQIVKIQNPSVGIYRITYKPEDVGEIKVSLVANYKVQYRLESQTEADKNSTMRIDGYFVENDLHTSDNALYTGNIQATMSVYDADYNFILSQPMLTADSQDHFTCEVSLAGLKSGTYYLVSAANGDGLARSSAADYTLTIVNHAPEAVNAASAVALRINDVLSENPDAARAAEPIDLNTFFADRNGDAMRYEVSGAGAVNAWIDDSILYIEATAAGSEVLTVTAYDDENMAAQIGVEVTVTDVKAMLEGGLLVVDTDLTASVQGKSQEVGVYARLYSADGQVMNDPALMEIFASGAQLFWQRADEQTANELPVAYDAETASLKGSLTTTLRSGEYQIFGTVTVKDATINLEPFSFTVGNVAPSTDYFSKLLKFYIEPLPVPVPNQPTCLEMDVNLADYFTDGDGEALSYSYVCNTTTDEKGNELASLSETIENGMLTISALNDGAMNVIVTAVDGDGETAEMTFCLEIVSVTDETVRLLIKWVLILAAALIVLKLFYYVALKPSYKPKMQLGITRADSYIDEKRLPSGKKTIKLSAYRNGDALEDTGIDNAMLSNITIKPGRGGSLVVTNGKKNKPSGGKQLSVTVAGRDVKCGKSERLYENGSIALQVTIRGEEGPDNDIVAWTYQRRQDD